MNIRRHALALILAAGLAGTSAFAIAASNPTPVDAEKAETPRAVRLLDEAKVSMKDAVAAAEKKHGGEVLRATLRDTREYGLVWDVRMEKGEDENRTRIRTFVDAKTGKVMASDVNEIARSWNRGEGRHCYDGNGRHHGYYADRADRHCR